MGVRDLRLGSVSDALLWLRSAAEALATTPAGSPERAARLAELAEAVRKARVLVNANRGRFAPELRLAVHAAEVLLARVQKSGAPPPPGDGQPADPATPGQARRVHPRRQIRGGR